jgi:hypothetical protein
MLHLPAAWWKRMSGMSQCPLSQVAAAAAAASVGPVAGVVP